MAVKKLIEVALPLDAINAASAREKSIRHGHPSTLHLWWARRPLAAARAVIWASLVDDPSSHPEQFPTEEEQTAERERLFHILEELVVWENSNNPRVLENAKAEIKKSMGDELPPLLDPFAGGGAIPLEAQRLGLEAYAQDLNPVAVTINKAMIEIPPKFAGNAPVNPDSREASIAETWEGNTGLAADVEYYGRWIKNEAYKKIGHLYPKVKVPDSQGGGEAKVITWLWARTVKCPNPACGHNTILVRSFDLSRKRGAEWHVVPEARNGRIEYSIAAGKSLIAGTVNRQGATCIHCSMPIDFDYVRKEGRGGRIGSQLMAIVAEGSRDRIYLPPTSEQSTIALEIKEPEGVPQTRLPEQALSFRVQAYGMDRHKKLFSNRQLVALSTFSQLLDVAQTKARLDAIQSGLDDDTTALANGGVGAQAYSEAIKVYLAIGLDRMTDINNALCSWKASAAQSIHVFTRQSLAMIWDYAENNVFNDAAGDYTVGLNSVIKVLKRLPANESIGQARQFDAQSDNGMRNIIVSTDPPYYDNIGYADLSDFFYVWLREPLKSIYPKMFSTMLVPKAEELIATPYRDNRGREGARDFFEEGMFHACQRISEYSRDDVPVTIYYAFKQSETETSNEIESTSSTGWETMLTAIIRAGFSITGTWPMRTEMANRSVASGSNALASSIVLVCRKRPQDAPLGTRRDFVATLKRELRPALDKLRTSNIAPVDLAQSAIGPGIGVYSRYSQVLEADGSPMTVRSALQIINQELDVYFSDQDSDLDRESRFCVELYTQNAFNDIRFGEADVLARAKNTSIQGLAAAGLVDSSKGVVHLKTRDELKDSILSSGDPTWFITQKLTYYMETGGVTACAEAVKGLMGVSADKAKTLAYRLFTIADKKNWTEEALAYNALVVAWAEIQDRAAQLAAETGPQMSLFDLDD